MSSNKYIDGIENVALAVARVAGSHYFDPDTRRFFNARVSAAIEAPDGVLYVRHSTAKPQWNIPRLYSVTAFTSEGTFDLEKDVDAKSARETFRHVVGMGCTY